jgi:cobalamin biosynthesis protein CbiD
MYSIRILDNDQHIIGEMMTATCSDITKFINKGFTVMNIETGEQITLESMNESLGVSDGAMILG